MRNLRIAIDNSIIPLLGKRLLAEIRASDVETFYQSMRRAG
jgi:hypothetical protein